jgi:Respiratory nitrate reductase beta C-terminal
MPMVWYIPPLSPVVDVLRDTGHDGEAAPSLFGAIDALRIPVGYLAELFTAGDARRSGTCSPDWPPCVPSCGTSTWAASRTPRSPHRSA